MLYFTKNIKNQIIDSKLRSLHNIGGGTHFSGGTNPDSGGTFVPPFKLLKYALVCEGSPERYALKRWTLMDSRWKRKEDSLGSPVDRVRSRARSEIKSMSVLLMGPNVSRASGMKTCVLESSWYHRRRLRGQPGHAPPIIELVGQRYLFTPPPPIIQVRIFENIETTSETKTWNLTILPYIIMKTIISITYIL